MKKYWKIIITFCVVTLVGLEAYEYFRDIKEQFVDVVGDKVFYEEEKADPVYVDSYTFDGKEIQFYFDNYYGITQSYIIKDGKEYNLYTNRSQWKSKDLTKILYIQTEFVDDYDIYMDREFVEPTIIENEAAKVKVYEFDSNAEMIAVKAGTQTFDEYTVMECRENRTFCDIEMKMDFNKLEEFTTHWERIRNVDELPHYTVTKQLFQIIPQFEKYVYPYGFQEYLYECSGGIDENGVGYVVISGPIESSIMPTYRLTKEQYEEFIEFVDSNK